MTTQEKLEQAQKVQYKLTEAQKHQKLITQIINNHAEANNVLPPVAVKTNAQYNNFMVLPAEYLPGPIDQFWKDYQNNVEMKIEALQGELSELIS